jgi:hypothetical protein
VNATSEIAHRSIAGQQVLVGEQPELGPLDEVVDRTRDERIGKRSRCRLIDKRNPRPLPPVDAELSSGEVSFLFSFMQGSIMVAEVRWALRKAWGFGPQSTFCRG